MPRVYIANKSGNVYTAAEKFGELVYITDGKVALTEVNNIYMDVVEVLGGSNATDYIIMAGPYSVVSIISAVFAIMHARLNILIYRDGEYIRRELDLSSVSNNW